MFFDAPSGAGKVRARFSASVLVTLATDPCRQNRFWLGADVALEVVSEEKPERDLVPSCASTIRNAGDCFSAATSFPAMRRSSGLNAAIAFHGGSESVRK